MKYKPLPPLEELKKDLDYNPETGVITWKRARSGVTVGQVAGSIMDNGYRKLSFRYALYQCSRIAYYIHHGVDPLENEVDHENGNILDNTIKNLRLTTHQDNCKNRKKQKNNTSGTTGVTWYKPTQKWRAEIASNGETFRLGHFVKKEDAIQAREKAEVKHHGEFRRQD